MIIKVPTKCCALAQLSNLANSTSIEEIGEQLELLTKEAKQTFTPGDNSGNGQTSVFVIVTPNEVELEEKLKVLNFKLANEFKRRTGYKQNGYLRMYVYNLI